jgi:hypothetical protein
MPSPSSPSIYNPHRTMARAALLAFLVSALGGCGGEAPSRCQSVCAREVECADKQNVDFDGRECVRECTELDREPAATALVGEHVACVFRAGKDCSAVLACP